MNNRKIVLPERVKRQLEIAEKRTRENYHVQETNRFLCVDIKTENAIMFYTEDMAREYLKLSINKFKKKNLKSYYIEKLQRKMFTNIEVARKSSPKKFCYEVNFAVLGEDNKGVLKKSYVFFGSDLEYFVKTLKSCTINLVEKPSDEKLKEIEKLFV